MARNRSRPAYQLHRASGQARVKINGEDVYLGPHNSPESHRQYDRVIAKWLAEGTIGAYSLSVDDLAILFCEHADEYYRKPDGTPTGEAKNMRAALRPLVQHFGTTLAREFTPKLIKAYREKLIALGRCRTSINRDTARIRGIFRWAVENDHVPVTVWQALTAVKGLAAGRTSAIESKAVTAVAQHLIDAVQPFVSRQVWACIQIQRFTGCRSGEVLQMRGCNLTMTGDVWEYRPSSHKGEHHGRRRVIMVGPHAQEIIREFLRPDLSAFLFSPADARAEWLASRTGPGRSKRLGTETRQAGQRYTTSTFCGAIRRGCERAFGMPDELQRINRKLPKKERERLARLAAAWRAEHCWHPHQIRHRTATDLRRECGIDSARAILGHSTVHTTELYAEQDEAKSRDVMRRLG